MSEAEQQEIDTNEALEAEQAIDNATEAVTIEASRLNELADTSATGDPMGMDKSAHEVAGRMRQQGVNTVFLIPV